MNKKNLHFRYLESKNFIKFLNKSKLDYALLGNLTQFPYKINNDLDIFVGLSSITEVKKLIVDFSNERNLIISNIIQYEYNCAAFELTKSSGNNINNIIIDLCTYYTQQYRDYINLSNLKKQKIKFNNFYYLKLFEEDNIYIYFLKKILKKDMNPESFKFFKQNKKYLLDNKNFSLGEKKIINSIFYHKTNEKFYKYNNLLINKIKKKGKIRILKEIKRLLFRINYKTGLHISFLGVDGSGKTTQKNLLIKSDIIRIFRGISVFHLYNKQFETKSLKVKPYNKSYGVFFSLLKIVYLFIRFLKFYLIDSFLLKTKTRLIVNDRNHFDVIIDPKRYGINFFKKFLFFSFSIFPNPDIIFLLSTSSNIIFNRSKELSKKELKENLEKYYSFLWNKKKLFILDAKKKPNTISREVIDIVYKEKNKKTKIILKKLK